MKKIALLMGLALATSATAQNRFDDVNVEATKVASNVHMVTGAGGNMALMHGADGVLLIDDQYQQMAEKISTKIKDLTGESVRYLINTHFHGDHVGSNMWFKEQHNSTIMAHDNVRKRLAADDDFNPAGLPALTFDSTVTLHINGDTVHVFYLPDGHTDGDVAVWFEKANVLHPGDLFFNERFPFIDLGSGGDVEGYIDNAETLIAKINEDTVIIPGHGPQATKADYQQFVDMIKATKAEVDAMRDSGMALEDALGNGLSDEFKPWAWNFITEERWIKTLY
ncbi:MBL fold metallo-hydrolase [Idiomarina seosinensis]|uniref:MBL fold metallo-hydrolase n=1 Tax=Idiomarina seosinensis TaxID=281739 RepID=A0A432ZDB3_9GAMM|nr:MBL fold metallo-hydrolase [Idiomarina seosinensis]RUO75362.1 MBL fold metallo-hydrolase [Idiomarina seosinensis]